MKTEEVRFTEDYKKHALGHTRLVLMRVNFGSEDPSKIWYNAGGTVGKLESWIEPTAFCESIVDVHVNHNLKNELVVEFDGHKDIKVRFYIYPPFPDEDEEQEQEQIKGLDATPTPFGEWLYERTPKEFKCEDDVTIGATIEDLNEAFIDYQSYLKSFENETKRHL